MNVVNTAVEGRIMLWLLEFVILSSHYLIILPNFHYMVRSFIVWIGETTVHATADRPFRLPFLAVLVYHV